MQDERGEPGDASLDAAPQGASEEGRPDTGPEGGEQPPGEGGRDPLSDDEAVGDPDAEQADPESGPAADEPGG